MRRYSFNACAALGLLVLAAPATHAQDNVAAAPPPAPATNAVVGSPLLRDFDLGGERTTPPAQQQPATSPPATVPSAQPAEARPQETQPARAASRPAPQAAPTAERPGMADYLSPQETAPLPIPSDSAPSDSAASVALSQALPQPAPALPQPETELASWPTSYWAAPAVLLALLLGFFLFQRRRRGFAAEETLQRSPLPQSAPQPAAPRPIPAGTVEVDLRPWLEIDFKPEKMVATADGATVHFDLLVKNVGKSPARNVRIQARMFNPSAEQQRDIKAFFAAPAASGDAFNVPPQLAARFKSSVVMPRDKVRQIEVQGRPLFIPTIAVNIIYEWGDGRTGQTSKSYVIGTEQQAAEKMGPFRLDLGPRIYRQVGGRPLDLARAV